MVSYVFIINFIVLLGFHLLFFEAHGYEEISITKAEPMETDSSFADFSKFRLKKVNRTHVITGEVTYFQELSNDIKCQVILFKKQGGEYRLTQFRIPIQGFCEFWNTEIYIIPDFKKTCDQCPEQALKQCPWKAQKYYIDGFKLETKNFPKNFEGDFMGSIQFLKDDKLLGGYNIYATIIR